MLLVSMIRPTVRIPTLKTVLLLLACGMRRRKMKTLKAVLFLVPVLAMLLVTSGYAIDIPGRDIPDFVKQHRTNEIFCSVPITIVVDHEFEAIIAVFDWITERYEYVEDDENGCWTTADTMYYRLKGDCEDWGILAVSMLRFCTTIPIPPERIWLALSLYPFPHTWVFYITPHGNYFSFNIAGGKLKIHEGQLFTIWEKMNDKSVERHARDKNA